VHRLALHALMRAHPDPGRVLAAWQAVLEQAPAYVPLAPADVRHSELLREQCRAYADDWTADLVEWAVPAAGS
jgi:hypothetical protein